MAASEFGGFSAALQLLFRKGIRYSTVIDVGCADGEFFLFHVERGDFRGAIPVHLDANALYAESLKAIREVVGGHYRIGAVSDSDGEIEMTMAAHPYWSSTRPEGDLYWQRLNGLAAEKVRVPTARLDTLRAELGLEPPFLLKLDVQGAELSVLRGAAKLLADTHVVVCEADIDDFQTINAALVERGFVLFDVTELSRLSDGTLGWFYPIYVSRAISHVLPKSFWEPALNEDVIRLQVERRKSVLAYNAQALQRIRASKVAAAASGPASTTATKIGRNQPCPCGSGRKYKHCCGAHTA